MVDRRALRIGVCVLALGAFLAACGEEGGTGTGGGSGGGGGGGVGGGGGGGSGGGEGDPDASSDLDSGLPEPAVGLMGPSAPVLVGIGSSVDVPFSITRDDILNAPVEISVTGLPDGVTADAVADLEGVETYFSLHLTVSGAASESGPTTVTVTASVYGTSIVESTTFALTVTPPPSFEAARASSELVVDQGDAASVDVNITRDGFTDPIVIHATATLTGLTTPDVEVGGSETVGAFEVSASADARLDLPFTVPLSVGTETMAQSLELSVRVRPVNAELDTSFGFYGVHQFAYQGAYEAFFDVACSESGPCYVAASKGAVYKFGADGELDSTFGSSGIIRLDAGSPAWFYGNKVAVTAGGAIVHVGEYGSGAERRLVVSRFDSTGTLDTSFATTGQLHIDLPGDGETVDSMRLRPDGSVLLAGSVENATKDVFLALVTTDGELDETFSDDGVVVLDGGGIDRAMDVVESGGFVLVGSSGPSMFLAKFTTAGDPDTAFDTDGIAMVTTPASCATTLAKAMFASGTDFLVVGYGASATCDLIVLRIDETGALDTTFGTSGYVVSLETNDFILEDVALDESGRVVVAGSLASKFAVGRLDASMALDTTFSTTGMSTLDFDPVTSESAYAVTIDSTDRIVAVGGGGQSRGTIGCFAP